MLPALSHVENAERGWKNHATAIYSSTFAALGLTFSILGPVLPTLAEQTHSSLTQISLLFIARSVGSLVASVGGGRMFDRLPGNLMVAIAMALMIITGLLVPLIGSFWLLLFCLFLSGIAHGIMNVGGNVLLIWTHGKDVAPYMNALHFFFGVGTFFAPILVAQVVLVTGSMTWAFWLVALITLPLLIYALLVRSPKPQQQPGVAREGKLDGWLVAGFCLIFAGYSGAGQAFSGWIFTYVTRLGLADATSAAYLNSVYWGALMIGRLISIPLTVRFSPKALLRADLIGALASIGLITLFPHSLWVIGVGSAGFGFSLATIFPTSMSLASRHMLMTGKVTSYFAVGSSLGALVLPWLVGQLFEPVGPETMVTLNFANIALTLLAFVLLSRRLSASAS